MNKLHSLAAIALVASGIFVVSQLSLLLLTSFYFYFAADQSLSVSEIVLAVIYALVIVAAIYLLIIRRRTLARKIVGDDTIGQPAPQLDWLPFAFRLAAVAAGIMMLPPIISKISAFVRVTDMITSREMELPPHFSAENMLELALLTFVATYLIRGAPHLVRWQTKKTLQQCAQPEQPPTPVS